MILLAGVHETKHENFVCLSQEETQIVCSTQNSVYPRAEIFPQCTLGLNIYRKKSPHYLNK
jgi:hypothetical protein